MPRFASALFVALTSVALLAGADWRQFRGTNNNPVAEGPAPPVEFSAEKNVAWKSELPGEAASSPIVVGGRVFLSAATGYKEDRLHVLCFDAASGERLWHRQFWATGRTVTHPTSSVAAPTAASDGEHIYAFYSSNDLICLDLDGNLQWYRGLTYDYPTAANDVGMAASPLVVGDTVIVQVENEGNSFAAGLNKATGEERWKVERSRAMNWSSPALLPGGATGNDLVLLQSRDVLTAHEPHTGKQVWSYEGQFGTIASPLAVEDRVFAADEGGLICLKASGRDKPELLWQQNKLSPSASSPLVYRGRVYALNRAGVLTCGHLEDGKVAWQTRLRGRFWATPVAVGDYLFCFNQDGVGHVVRLGDEGEIIATNELGDQVMGTPAIVEGAMYVQSAKWLWKIAGEGAE